MCVYEGSVSFQREMSEMCHYQCIVMIINQCFPVDLNLTHWPISPATKSLFRDFITGTKDYKHIEILVKKKKKNRRGLFHTTLMECAKPWLIPHIFHVIANKFFLYIRFELWAHKRLVKLVSGRKRNQNTHAHPPHAPVLGFADDSVLSLRTVVARSEQMRHIGNLFFWLE